MFKSLTREIVLSVQAKSGLTSGFLIGAAIAAFAALMAFVFLCVAAYAWLSVKLGSVFAGLVVAGVFVLITVIALLAGMSARKRARERAILERAARAHAPSWLIDPKILSTAVQIGRTVGWQRLIPVALLGFMATQWAREYRERGQASDKK